MSLSKKILITTSLISGLLFSAFQTTQALTFTEVVNLLQAPDINLPLGVTNPKGNIGFILSNLFWGTADGTKNGKIKPQYLDYSGISAWTQSGSNAWYTGTGNIGIGSTVPSDLLTLSGSSGPIIALNGLTTNYRGLKMSDSTGVEKWFAGANNLGNYVIRQNGLTDLMTFSSGNVGIGIATPVAKLDIRSTGAAALYAINSATSGTSYGAVIQANSTATENQALYIAAAGATTNKGIYIEVNNPAAGANNWALYSASQAQSYFAGNVGIGTASPAVKLDISGQMRVYGSSSQITVTGTNTNDAQVYMVTDANARGFYIDNDDANKLKFYTGYGKGVAGKEVTFDNEGNVGIGTTTPGTYKLYVNGAGYLGATAWVYSSDRRLKENIAPLKYGIKEIMKLDTKKFDYIKGDKNNLGFIAQDVQSILPELVTTQPTGMLGLKTDMIIPVLVNAMKEQQKQIEKLTDEVRELKKR